jgi:hypothetical protein
MCQHPLFIAVAAFVSFGGERRSGDNVSASCTSITPDEGRSLSYDSDSARDCTSELLGTVFIVATSAATEETNLLTPALSRWPLACQELHDQLDLAQYRISEPAVLVDIRGSSSVIHCNAPF